MAEEVIRRQGSATDHGSFTGAAGEITVENTNWNLRIHDGVTAGGYTTLMDSDLATTAQHEAATATDLVANPAGVKAHLDSRLANGSGSGVAQVDVDEIFDGKMVFNTQGSGPDLHYIRISDPDQSDMLSMSTRGSPGSRDITFYLNESADGPNSFEFRSHNDGNGFANIMRMHPGGGVEVGNPTGGEQGLGTINAEAVYDDGSLLTDYVLDAYIDGQIDYDYYDSKVLPKTVESETETEEVEEEEEVTEPVTTVREEWDEKQQAYIRRTITEQRAVYDEYSVKDEQGNEVGVRRVQRTQKVKKQVPKHVEVHDEHAPAKRYEFDDLDCDAFWAKCEKFRKLPAFQRCEDNLQEGQQRPSMGQVAQALTETVEDMAVHIHELNERLKKLER